MFKLFKNSSIRSTVLTLIVSLIFLIVVGIAYMSITFGWFAKNEVVDAYGMNISVNHDDTVATYYIYKYDTARERASLQTEVVDDNGNSSLVNNTISSLVINPFDTIFTSRNVYTPVVVRIEITGKMVKESGTINISLDRLAHNDTTLSATYKDGLYNGTLNEYASSVLYFKGAAKSTLATVRDKDNNLISLTDNFTEENANVFWEGYKTAFTNYSGDKKMFTTIDDDSVEKEDRTYTKIDEINIPVSYTSADWTLDNEGNRDKLNIFFFMAYDETYVNYYVEEHKKTNSLTESLSTPINSDIVKISARHD